MIKWANQKQTGFTIIELLIVIVVIAILATISIVAYSGIQTRASDSAVRADIRNLAMKVMEYYSLNDEYPSGTTTTVFPGNIRYAVNKQAYATGTNNLYYCVIPTGSSARFSIAARSKSGDVIAYYDGGFNDYTGTYSASTNICPNTGIPTTEAGFGFHYGVNTANTWFAWTNG